MAKKQNTRSFNVINQSITGNYGEQLIYERLKELSYSVRLDPQPTASNFDFLLQQQKNVPEYLEVKVAAKQVKLPQNNHNGINRSACKDYGLIKEPILIIFIDRTTKSIYGNYFTTLRPFGITQLQKVLYPVNMMIPLSNLFPGFRDDLTQKEVDILDDLYIKSKQFIPMSDKIILIRKIFSKLFRVRYKDILKPDKKRKKKVRKANLLLLNQKYIAALKKINK